MKNEIKEKAQMIGEQMRKGYVSYLVLLVLNKNPSHGYEIIKEINRRSFGMWNPSTSTIYHILESLEGKDLISILKEEEEGRQKKIYEITSEGENTLELLIETYQKMQEAMRRMIFSSIKLTNEVDLEKVKDFISHKDPIFGINDLENSEEKIKILEIKKSMMEQRLEEMKIGIRNIDVEISRLKNRNTST